jgi:hypothetical protein
MAQGGLGQLTQIGATIMRRLKLFAPSLSGAGPLITSRNGHQGEALFTAFIRAGSSSGFLDMLLETADDPDSYDKKGEPKCGATDGGLIKSGALRFSFIVVQPIGLLTPPYG